MSTIKVTNIDPPSAGGAVKVNGVAMPNAGPLSNRNLIINGAMQVAQRGTSFTGRTTNGYAAVDRYDTLITSAGTWTISQSTDSPSEFSNSVKYDCTTANGSLSAGSLIFFTQKIEAQNLQHLAYGTADAQDVTFSFYFKTNKNGVYTVELFQGDASRSIGFEMNVTQSGWQRYEFVIPGDTAGIINNDNGTGFWCVIWLAAGTTYTSGTFTNGAWNTGTAADRVSSNQVNFADNTSNECFITGVQLEVGSQATPFEHRSFGDELARCQRYYWMIQNENARPVCQGTLYDTNRFFSVVHFPVTMRTAPTLDVSNTADYFEIFSNGSADQFSTMTIGNTSVKSTELRAESGQGVSGRIAGHAAWVRTNNASAYIAVTAEL